MGVYQARMMPRSALKSFLERLEMPVAVPIKVNGDTLFGFAPIEEMADRYINSVISPVKFSFPQTQILWRYDLSKTPPIEIPDEPKEMAIFGIRSCDVLAFRYLEYFFSKQFEDTPFLEAARKTLLISVTCQEPGDNCFCVCANAGPSLSEGFDIQLTEIGDDYLVEVGTDKGMKAVEKGGDLMGPAPDWAISKKEELKEETLQKFTITCHFATGIRKLTTRKVPEELWRRMAARCIECGGCAFVCPMCTCFDVADYPESEERGWRERCWDSCQFAGYSREASGANPRPDKLSRFKRRFYHKLSYFYLSMDGVHGCVGCGRCIQACFGMVDMPAVVNCIREERI
jgi:ferredoxin